MKTKTPPWLFKTKIITERDFIISYHTYVYEIDIKLHIWVIDNPSQIYSRLNPLSVCDLLILRSCQIRNNEWSRFDRHVCRCVALEHYFYVLCRYTCIPGANHPPSKRFLTFVVLLRTESRHRWKFAQQQDRFIRKPDVRFYRDRLGGEKLSVFEIWWLKFNYIY